MSNNDMVKEHAHIQHANFKLGFFIELNINLALKAATVIQQDDYIQIVGKSAILDLAVEQEKTSINLN